MEDRKNIELGIIRDISRLYSMGSIDAKTSMDIIMRLLWNQRAAPAPVQEDEAEELYDEAYDNNLEGGKR